MRALMALAAAAGMAAAALAQEESAPEACLRTQTSFDLVVHASYARTAPLFGPQGERAWAGEHWDPQFVYPRPAKDVEGAVFTVRHGATRTVWVNTLFDVEGRHFQYVYFIPDGMVTVIDVRFKPEGAEATAVHVVYTRTALTAEGNPRVRAMTEGDRKAGREWQQAINACLARGEAGGKH